MSQVVVYLSDPISTWVNKTNEIAADVGNMAALSDSAATLVAAINAIDSDVGSRANLTFKDNATSLVAAINNLDDRFIEFMKYQIQRAREYYERAEKGITMLDRNARLPVYLACYNYAKILNNIEENNYDVFSSRAHLTKFEKLSILPQIIYKINIAS